MPRKKKETAMPDESRAPAVVETPLEDILADRFNRYSKYIIQERALPDARDGLKPVQRRILWAMWEDGNTFNHPYHKSAKTVGNVIGNYHPHGDSSVYDALVRMSQDWKIRTPLIDMQGNNGSIDDDPAAAMRYTEARLSAIANYMLEDIDKNTVEWAPNFSDEKMEPVVLPARYPNLLVNGITGIAAGYATNIPPHNLGEVLQATMYRIEHPACSFEELTDIIKGPDFPTGGIVMGMDGVRQAMKTGRGKFFIRSKTEIEQTKTIQRIIVHEIPYEVVKSQLVKRIDEIRLNHKIDGLLDVRDESDRNGMRIVIDIKKEANAEAIRNYLFKNTDLQISYSPNVTAIVRQAPVVMGIEQILDAFIDHREEIVIRRTQFDLAGREKRFHIVEGLIKAVSILDEVISLIRSSKNKADSKVRLMEAFDFTEAQAEAIVMLQLYRLSNTDILELQKEAKSLQKEIRRLRSILQKQDVRHKLMIEELQEMYDKFSVPRKTQLVEEAHEIVIDQKAMIADEQVMVTISHHGYIKKVSLRSYNSAKDSLTGLKEDDRLIGTAQCSTLDTLIYFTDKGKYGEIPVYKIEEARWKDTGAHVSAWLKSEPSERIVSAFLYSTRPQNLQFVLASRKGMGKRLEFDSLPNLRGRTSPVMTLAADDEMIGILPVQHKEQPVLFASRKGKAVVFEAGNIPLYNPRTRGVRRLNPGKEDQLLQLAIPEQSGLLLLSQNNQPKRLRASDLPLSSSAGAGTAMYRQSRKEPVYLKQVIPVSADSMVQVWNDGAAEEIKASRFPLKDAAASFMSETFADDFQILPALSHLENGTWGPEEEIRLFDDSALGES